MQNLIIRDLDDTLSRRLHARAAAHGRSIEDEALNILRSAFADASSGRLGLADRIRDRFAPLGGADDIDVPPREGAGREPPSFD